MHAHHTTHVHADLLLVHAEHAERVERARGYRLARAERAARREARRAADAAPGNVTSRTFSGRAGPVRVRLAHGRQP